MRSWWCPLLLVCAAAGTDETIPETPLHGGMVMITHIYRPAQ
jgi:hypothetical protein